MATAPSDCGSLPIFVTGYDAVGPAKNDAMAIEDTPRWALLHRRVDPGRPSTPWYLNQPGCETSTKPATIGWQCHEYPFWVTLQAHGGPFNDGVTPRIMWTKEGENGLQGRRLGHFLNGKAAGDIVKWPGCDIPAQTDAGVAAFAGLPGRELLVRDSAFLNVPIGEYGGRIKTVGLCTDRPRQVSG